MMAPIAVETLHLSHLPEQPVYVALFTGVTNASQLLDRVQAAGRDEFNVQERADLEYAFLDAASILSTTHLLSAVFRALNDQSKNRLKSKNIHSEIVFCLSPNNNIGESFRRFGVAKSTTNLLVVKVPDHDSTVTAQSIAEHLDTRIDIKGSSVAFSNETLAACSHIDNIKKIYKITDDSPTQQAKRKRNDKLHVNGDSSSDAPKIENLQNIESIILGTMALRGS
ncbi:CGI-121-domain-containing protein [Pseudovirgaria hyperparasitica]|uniref:EKC/KEOPS complex subunit CGI121 n=1 Tax=Pseudovirgaria hyperparasitica TaxID=470096 RepID=A0A6A6VZJ9_9PEZI|nr:CGI-121-domain-containing protein [Pseudovirgaria hyperparasitica]KAF2755276.1 CGI-121-domain-containing protein [Pseudovirgaria hyperparasitica]